MLNKIRYYLVATAALLVRNTHDELLSFADKSAEYEDLAYMKASEKFSKRIAKVSATAEEYRKRINVKIDKGIDAAKKQARIDEATLHAEMQSMQREYDRLASRIGETRGYLEAVVNHHADNVLALQNLKRKHDFVRVD